MSFKAVVEIPAKSFYKYEFNKESNILEINRVLPIPCPYNYGFLKDLPLSADGDPLDIFIVSPEPIVPLTEVSVRIWGILLCTDQEVEDNKVIATIDSCDFKDYDYFRTIKWYLENYKEGFKVLEYKIFNDEILFKNFVGGFK